MLGLADGPQEMLGLAGEDKGGGPWGSHTDGASRGDVGQEMGQAVVREGRQEEAEGWGEPRGQEGKGR